MNKRVEAILVSDRKSSCNEVVLASWPCMKLIRQRRLTRCSCHKLAMLTTFISIRLHFHKPSFAKFECHGCWLFIVLWRVGEHQFSSPKCPRSFHCGEHFPSSPFSQATIALRKKKAIVVKRFSISRQLARATTVSIHMHATRYTLNILINMKIQLLFQISSLKG